MSTLAIFWTVVAIVGAAVAIYNYIKLRQEEHDAGLA